MTDRLPLGVMPKKLWLEKRLEDLQRCIKEYVENGYPLQEEWVREYNELLKILADS